MSDVVIRAEGIGKRYRLGTAVGAPYGSLREVIARRFQAPFRPTGAASPTGDPHIWALRDVDLEVRSGEVLGIVGRNGAGKSTLLKILSRITRPTVGRAVLHGRVGSLIEVGTGFHPELTGRENVQLNGAILGMSRREILAKFDEIVSFAELETFIDTPVKRYSSGMYMRLAFSVAAHLEPEILVVDEVLAVGDAAFQRKSLGKMEDVSKAGRTVLFVSHNMPAVLRLCTRAVLLQEGRLVRSGTPTDVTAYYLAREDAAGATRTWDRSSAPGTDALRIASVALVGPDGAASAVLEVGQPFKVRIEYSVHQPNLAFRCSAIFNTQGVVAFASVEPTEQERTAPGLYHSTVEVPAHLLAEGEYVVGLSMFSSRGAKQHLAQVRDALSFHVFDPMTGDSARGDYAENLGGVLRPRLRWESGPVSPAV